MCNNNGIYDEALSHCRWKTVLKKNKHKIKIKNFKNKNFEEIMVKVYTIFKNIKGIGMLSMYDISAGICRYYDVKIDKVYIIGNGPRRAIKILNLKKKKHNIQKKLNLYYVEKKDIDNAFKKLKLKIPRHLKTGDDYESYICNWQKAFKKK